MKIITFNILDCYSRNKYQIPATVQKWERGNTSIGRSNSSYCILFKNFNWALQWSNSGDYRLYGKKEIYELLLKHGFRVSNCYLPKSVKVVVIPKKNRGKLSLGIPTVQEMTEKENAIKK